MPSAFEAVALVMIWLAALLIVVTLAEAALGVFVLRRGGTRLAPRLLALYLLLQPLAWGAMLLALRIASPEFNFEGFLIEAGLPSDEFLFRVGTVCISLLPAALLAFAVSYPAEVSAVRHRRWLLAVPFGPSLVFLFLVWQGPSADALGSGLPASLGLAIAYEGIGTFGAGLAFWFRARRAETTLERRRLTYMAKVIAAPTVLGLLGMAALNMAMPSSASELMFLIAIAAIELLVLAVVLVPALGLGYGLLRYKVVDLDLKIRTGFRFTLTSSVIAAAFFLAFFAVSEAAERLLTLGTNSQWFGLLGALAVSVAFHPLHRMADRLAKRVVPTMTAQAAPQTQIVYRATFEELSADRVVNANERRTLSVLAKHLGLTESETTHIESTVANERAQSSGARVS